MLRQFAQRVQLGELRGVVGIRRSSPGAGRRRARRRRRTARQISQSSSKCVVQEVFLVVTPGTSLAMIEPPRETMPVTRLTVSGT